MMKRSLTLALGLTTRSLSGVPPSVMMAGAGVVPCLGVVAQPLASAVAEKAADVLRKSRRESARAGVLLFFFDAMP